MPTDLIITLPNQVFIRFAWLDDDQIASLVESYKEAKAKGSGMVVYRHRAGEEPAENAMKEYLTTTPRWQFPANIGGWLEEWSKSQAAGMIRNSVVDMIVWPEALLLSDVSVESKEGPSRYRLKDDSES